MIIFIYNIYFQFLKHDMQFPKSSIKNRKFNFLLRLFELSVIFDSRSFGYRKPHTQVFVKINCWLPVFDSRYLSYRKPRHCDMCKVN